MSSRVSRSVILAPIVALSGLALAQHSPPAEPSADRPRFWVWGPDGVPCNITPSPTDFQTATLAIGSQPNETGTQAAQRIAAYVIQHTRTSTWTPLNWGLNDCNWDGISHLPDLSPQVDNTSWPNTICVSIKQFGAPHSNTVVQTSNGPVDWTNSDLPFYRETDRFRDYKLGSYSTANGSFGFPTAGGQNYRHPFIANAMGENSPLRNWLRDFLKEYRRLQGPGNPFLPDISRFFMDTEVDFLPGELREIWDTDSYGAYSHNDVWMLEQIFDSRRPEHRAIDHAYLDYWSTVPVPGDQTVDGVCSPVFCTLKDIYLRDAEAYGLPIHASGPEAGLPNLDVLQSTRQIGQDIVSVPASDAVNRNIMRWWADVQTRVRDYVMKRCLYDVIHEGFDYLDENNQTVHVDGWPNALVGNYNTSMHSGELRHSAIMQDSIAPNDDAWWRPDFDHRLDPPQEPLAASNTTTNVMPACSRSGNIDGSVFFRMNPGESEVRWGSQLQYSFGNFDSPVNYTYPVGNPQIDWKWSRQRNAYGRKIVSSEQNRTELRHEVVLRLHRHELESTLAGYKSGQTRQVIPWIQSARLPDLVTYSCAELAQELALIRSKRIKEAILFHSFDFRAPNVPADSWHMNEMIIRDVYTPKVTNLGIVGPSGTTGINEPSELAKIEDTLRNASEQAVTLDVSSQAFGDEQVVAMLVDLVERYPTVQIPVGFSALVNDAAHPRDFLVNIECRAYKSNGDAKTDVNIKVECRRTNGQMFTLATDDGAGAVSSGRNESGEIRCYWHVPNSAQDPSTSRVDPSRLRIYAVSEDLEPFTITFDLIQLIPIMRGPAHILGSQCEPTVDLGASSSTVAGTVFRDAGYLVAWSHELTSGGDDEAGPQVVRIYRSTGDPDHPLADITCATQQQIVNIGGVPRGVRIWYKPNPNGQTKTLPAGSYELSVFDRGDATVSSVCQDGRYHKLYTAMSGPIERDPLVKSEHFGFSVPYAGQPGPVDCNVARPCAADVDDGSGTGTLDGGVTIDDLLYYLVLFEVGSICADVDDGSWTGTLDAGVTIDDLLYYLFRFEAGC